MLSLLPNHSRSLLPRAAIHFVQHQPEQHLTYRLSLPERQRQISSVEEQHYQSSNDDEKLTAALYKVTLV